MTQLIKLLQSVSTQDLNKMIAVKKKLEALTAKKASLQKQVTSINKQIDSLQTSIGKLGPRPTATKKKAAKTKPRKRIPQPSLSSVVQGVLKGNKKALTVNEIHDAVLKAGYKTKAKNFKAGLRILLYKNQKGLFKKAAPGKFKLARGGGKKTTSKKPKPVKKAAKKKKPTKKKSS